MIVGHLKDYRSYDFLGEDIFIGLEFLSKLKTDVDLGVYDIQKNVKAIISGYETMASFKHGYEAHRKVIDIQYPLIGRERVRWSHIQELSPWQPYDATKDVEYLRATQPNTNRIDIGNGVFAIMFPNDAHGPQEYVNGPEQIKKATIKINFE